MCSGGGSGIGGFVLNKARKGFGRYKFRELPLFFVSMRGAGIALTKTRKHRRVQL